MCCCSFWPCVPESERVDQPAGDKHFWRIDGGVEFTNHWQNSQESADNKYCYMTSWYIASGEWVRPECNCQIYKEANWQTHTDGEITNPYMRAGRAEQPGGRRRDTDKNTDSPLRRRWKWVTYVYWFCCFSSLMLKLLNGWKQEGLPEAQTLNMCIFYFPNHFSWQAGTLFFFFPRHPLFVVFLLSLFSSPFKSYFPH